MKKNYLIFILLTIIMAFSSFEAYSRYFNLYRERRTKGFYTYLSVTVNEDEQDDFLDSYKEIAQKIGLNTTLAPHYFYGVNDSDFDSNRINIHFTELSENHNLIFMDGSKVTDLTSDSFYYSDASNDLNSKLYNPNKKSEVTFVPLNKEIFFENRVLLIVSSSSNTFENDIELLITELNSIYQSVELGSSSIEQFRDDYTNNELSVIEISNIVIVTFISCMVMLIYIIKNTDRFRLMKLEGQTNFDIYVKFVLKHVFVTMLFSVSAGICAVLLFVPFKIVMSGSASYFIYRLMKQIILSLLIYTVFTILPYLFIVNTRVNRLSGDDREYKQFTLKTLLLKGIVILSSVTVIISGLNYSKNILNATFEYSKVKSELEGAVWINTNMTNVDGYTQDVKSALKDFYNENDAFWIQRYSASISESEYTSDYGWEEYYVDKNFLIQHNLNYEVGQGQTLVLFPKDWTKNMIDEYKNLSKIDAKTTIYLDKELPKYIQMFSYGEFSSTIDKPIVYSQNIVYDHATYSGRIAFAGDSIGNFIANSNNYMKAKGFEDILTFTDLQNEFEESYKSYVFMYIKETLALILLIIGVVLLNISIIKLLILRNQMKKIEPGKTILKYISSQLLVTIITGLIMFIVFKIEVSRVMQVLALYLAIDVVLLIISYFLMKRGVGYENRS